MSEVLGPTRKDFSDEFLRGFEGMTETPVSREELVAALEALIDGYRRQDAARTSKIPGFFRAPESRTGRCLAFLLRRTFRR